SVSHRLLPSFPTRRSSDLLAAALARAPVPALPGCATVSEALTLAGLGFAVLKFFPAEAAGGVAFLRAIAAPLPNVRFCPTGGIRSEEHTSELQSPCNLVCR